jgi:hypothetical protein
MITEFFIEGQKVNISTKLSSLMTFRIDDIKNFASRETAFSKVIVAPGDANNNKIFGNIFDVGISNDYDPALPNVGINFNASVSANCIIFQDFLQTFKGTVRVIQINIVKGQIEYELAVSGELTKLNVALTSGLLENLDFSAYDSVYSIANITGSWDNPGGSGLYYPLIDYGLVSTDKHNFKYSALRPALYCKEYIDKMMAAANFRYDSALINTARFKSIVIPHNQKVLQRSTTNVLIAKRDTVQSQVIDYSHTNQDYFHYDDVVTSVFTLTGGERLTYNAPDTINLVMNMTLNFSWKTTNNTILLEFQKNGSTIASKTLGNTGGVFVTSGFWQLNGMNLTFATGDYIEVRATVSDSSLGHFYTLDFNPSPGIVLNSATPILVPVLLGDTVTVNDTIPKNIRQVDFLLSIIRLFNLYVYEDKYDENHIYITPYVDFFSTATQNSDDWSYKLDRSQPIKIKPMSEIKAKVYNFNYASDSDYYSDLYNKRYNQTYGSYIFDTPFEFVSQSQNVDLIFASTPLVGYAGEEKVYPTIFNKSGEDEEQTDSVIRLMQTKKVTGLTNSWDILAANGSTLTTINYYGYAGHYDDPDNITNDLNFGALQELFFILLSGDLSVTQFNIYWSPYMAEITDKDSKLFVGFFKLNPIDILNLDFSKYKTIDGDLYRLNNITDYNLNIPDTCQVELLKVINTVY